MDTFWALFKESVIIQALLALVFSSAVCYLFVTAQEVPGELLTLLGTIIGFYFGAKTQTRIMGG